MRTAIFDDDRKEPAALVPSMTWLAVASFAIGFAGYLVFGLNFLV